MSPIANVSKLTFLNSEFVFLESIIRPLNQSHKIGWLGTFLGHFQIQQISRLRLFFHKLAGIITNWLFQH